VHVGHRREELSHDSGRVGLDEHAALHDVVHELTAVKWLREEKHPVAEPFVTEEAHDIRMIQRRPQANLALRLPCLPCRHRAGVDDLHRRSMISRSAASIQHHAKGATA
jgi:hypothetical protein